MPCRCRYRIENKAEKTEADKAEVGVAARVLQAAGGALAGLA
jgi:hypothetical protein